MCTSSLTPELLSLLVTRLPLSVVGALPALVVQTASVGLLSNA